MDYDPNAINTVGELIAALQRYDDTCPVRMYTLDNFYPTLWRVGVVTDEPSDGTGAPETPEVWLIEGRREGRVADITRTRSGTRQLPPTPTNLCP
jgi:hypothetical protein